MYKCSLPSDRNCPLLGDKLIKHKNQFSMRQFRVCAPCGIRADKPRQNWAFWTCAACREYLSSRLWANTTSSFRSTPYIGMLRKLLPRTLPPPPQIFSVATQSRGKTRVQYSHSHSVFGMKTSFYEKVYKMF